MAAGLTDQVTRHSSFNSNAAQWFGSSPAAQAPRLAREWVPKVADA
jgi:hypothetical protein